MLDWLDRILVAAILATSAGTAAAAPQTAPDPTPAPAVAPTPASPPAKKKSAFDEIWSVPKLYKNDDADVLNELRVVGRHTYAKSDDPNGVRLGRYENVVASGRGDRYHERYAGPNYYIYGHRLKAQTGVTYADLRDRAGDDGHYDGWTWTTARRLSW